MAVWPASQPVAKIWPVFLAFTPRKNLRPPPLQIDTNIRYLRFIHHTAPLRKTCRVLERDSHVFKSAIRSIFFS